MIAQYNTPQTGSTCQAVVLGCKGKLNDTRRTQVTLLLLFIAVSLPYLTEADFQHACFPGIRHEQENIPTSNAGVRSCFKATSGNNVERKKKGKGGTFPREIAHQMPQQFLATPISVRGKG